MPTRLTLASNGCDRETGRGQEHVESKALRDQNRCRSAKGQGKTCMANTILCESQAWYLWRAMTQQRLTRHARVERRDRLALRSEGSRASINRGFDPVTRTTPHRGVNGRTGRLSTSDLSNIVNAGSPKRAGFTSPAWRRSHHISQMPGVMPGTAAYGRTAMHETAVATQPGIAARRVKGDVSAEAGNFMMTRGSTPRMR